MCPDQLVSGCSRCICWQGSKFSTPRARQSTLQVILTIYWPLAWECARTTHSISHPHRGWDATCLCLPGKSFSRCLYGRGLVVGGMPTGALDGQMASVLRSPPAWPSSPSELFHRHSFARTVLYVRVFNELANVTEIQGGKIL